MRTPPPKKRDERGRWNTYAREWICHLLGRHDFVGWLAPPMPKLRNESGRLPVVLFRCKRCGQEVVRYPDESEEWL